MILGNNVAFRPFPHFPPMRDLPPLSPNVRDACVNCGGGPTPETRFITRTDHVNGHANWCPTVTHSPFPTVHRPTKIDHDANQLIARIMRAAGASIGEIVSELGESERTIWRWVHDVTVTMPTDR